MMIAEPPVIGKGLDLTYPPKPDFRKQLGRALTDINAPIRYSGPGILAVGGMILKQLLNSFEPKSR
jgi:hypothetical protein